MFKWPVSATCVSPTVTLQSDADKLTACATITGGITIASNAVGDIRVDGVEAIHGDFRNDACDTTPVLNATDWCNSGNGTALTSLSSSTLLDIDGQFALQSLPLLTTLSFPKLNRVAGIYWKDLPSLSNVSLLGGITALHNPKDDITIESADQLTSLHGLDIKNIITMTINLTHLADLPLPALTANSISVFGGGLLNLNLSSLLHTDTLEIAGCAAVTFRDLQWAADITLHDNSFEVFSLPLANTTWGTAARVNVLDNLLLRNLSLTPLGLVSELEVLRNPVVSIVDLSHVTQLYNADINGALTK